MAEREKPGQPSVSTNVEIAIVGHYETVYHLGGALFGFGGYYKVIGYDADGGLVLEGGEPALRGVCSIMPWTDPRGKETAVITNPLPGRGVTLQLVEDLEISPFSKSKPKEIAARVFKEDEGRYLVRLYCEMPNGRTLEEFARELPPMLTEKESRERDK